MNKINEAINGAYSADKYSLGAHWIYDANELINLNIDWNELNNPNSKYHPTKKAGDFTHYGDHMKILHDYIKINNKFDIEKYKNHWLEKMKTYEGYIDGSTSKSIEIFTNNKSELIGYHSEDLSCIGRIAPLLLVSNDLDNFIVNVTAFVSMTHSSELSVNSAKFFANFLYRVVNGENIEDVLKNPMIHISLKKIFDDGMNSKNDATTDAISKFGLACPIDGGLQGVIHLLTKYSDYKLAMIANSKAGGDNAARGMIVGMLIGSSNSPKKWS